MNVDVLNALVWDCDVSFVDNARFFFKSILGKFVAIKAVREPCPDIREYDIHNEDDYEHYAASENIECFIYIR